MSGTSVDSIRRQLDHPIIDGDGHLLEFLPVLRDLFVEESDEKLAQVFDRTIDYNALHGDESDVQRRVARSAWWAVPARNTLDRATATLPALMYERLDEFGIDFALLYPSLGLFVNAVHNDDVRQVMARACNRYYAEMYAPYRDRLEPVAIIPAHDPAEAIAELDHAVLVLGLKAISLSGAITRPVAGANAAAGAHWVDTIGHDSLYDYDPFWQRCVELKVSPTFHGSGAGWGSHASTKSFVFNHVGHFAAAQEATCRSIVLGGVARRFPELHFSFLEGGAAWAATLCADLIGHFERRNIDSIDLYDPRRIDQQLFSRLMQQYGEPRVRDCCSRLDYALFGAGYSDLRTTPEQMNEFEESGITDAEQIVDLFTTRLYFGCEADDPMAPVAFDRTLPPVGSTLRAMFASDIGHFDVPDARAVLPEAWELVERGYIDVVDFRSFTCSNAASLLTAQNPDFFAGTKLSKIGIPDTRRC